MEVREQCANNLEFEARIDEKVGFTRGGANFSLVLLCGKFKGAHCCGAHGYDAAAFAAGLVDLFCGRCRDGERL